SCARAQLCSYFFFFLLILNLHCSPLFPYTTLFRSRRGREGVEHRGEGGGGHVGAQPVAHPARVHLGADDLTDGNDVGGRLGHDRSEEHTSELQSRENLVCRLLLDKKKRSLISVWLL